MICLIASCAWICAVTLASVYAGASYRAGAASQKPQQIEGLDHKKT